MLWRLVFWHCLSPICPAFLSVMHISVSPPGRLSICHPPVYLSSPVHLSVIHMLVWFVTCLNICLSPTCLSPTTPVYHMPVHLPVTHLSVRQPLGHSCTLVLLLWEIMCGLAHKPPGKRNHEVNFLQRRNFIVQCIQTLGQLRRFNFLP